MIYDIFIMEEFLNTLSNSNDENIKKALNDLISKYNQLKKNSRSPAKSHRSMSSFDFSLQTNRAFHMGAFRSDSKRHKTDAIIPIRKSSNRTPKTNKSLFAIDQSLMIQNIFNKLSEDYSYPWIRGNTEKEYHVIIVKQFWLDCCACDQNFMKILMDPLHDKVWINYESFFKSFEGIKSKGLFSSLSFKNFSGTKENNLRLQKMLCKEYLVFFSVIRYETGNDLDRENLCKALSMIENKSKILLNEWADKYMNKCSEIHRVPKSKIEFKDYFKLIMLLEYFDIKGFYININCDYPRLKINKAEL